MNSDLLVVLTTLGLYAGLVISPGPGFALITRMAISGRPARAYSAALGFGVAATFYAGLTMAGLAVMIERIGWLAGAIQIAGGCYLVYFGVSAWRAARSTDAEPPAGAQQQSASLWQSFRIGVLVDLSNPKGIAFFLSLYSVAIPVGTAAWAKAAILIGGFAIEVAWYSLVARLFASAPARALYRRFGAWIERGIGTLLTGAGLRMIVSRLSF
ncbi:LysE family transporter [Salinisphaera sp. T31B1]|uniref:LysE family transporter n=1 Tax=Salinisphaera sp. T31B1 TaxID=727963 RepID=UPI003340B22D